MDRRKWNDAEEEPLYTRRIASRIARISMDLIHQCEQEELIQLRVMRGGGQGLSRRDVRRLARIRRLREDLELELPAIEVVLRMRKQMIDLMRQLDEMERMMAKREEEMMAEIRSLQQRIAEDFRWE